MWLDDLTLHPLPVPLVNPPPPAADASSFRPGFAPAAAADGDSATAWRSGPGDPEPVLTLDFGGLREFGGLVVDWVPGARPRRYRVEVRDPAGTWSALDTVERRPGTRDYLYLPDAEGTAVRLRVLEPEGPDGAGVAEVSVEPLAFSSTRNDFFSAVAAGRRRGLYPRGFVGEQSYWTVVGVDADPREGLLSEDGALETGAGAFSVEPFVERDGRLLTWADGASRAYLEDGDLPIPSVERTAGGLALTVTAFGHGAPEASGLAARYRLANRGEAAAAGTFYLALRPFQVNPPTQFLNTRGGVAALRSITRDGNTVVVNGDRRVMALTPPEGFGAVPYGEGSVVADWLDRGRLPGAARVEDPFEAASAALAWPFRLAPGESTEVDLFVPLYGNTPVPGPGVDGPAWTAAALDAARRGWRERLDRIAVTAPGTGDRVARTVRAQMGYILVNRAGPAIQPGTRSYARSWIRDGALTSSALLRLGDPEDVRAFMTWFAPHQYANGKIPCVVDRRGADPVPEHDSSGEFIFLVAEYLRYTGDRATAESMYPHVAAAVAYLDSLRHQRLTPEWSTPETREFHGILPPSISHEGYSAKPMHSYWDDFWALKGFGDAAWLAGELDRPADRNRFAALRDSFRTDLTASIGAAMERHGIDTIPGCADLGDFDPTSTTIALSPLDGGAFLPPEWIHNTFERYWTFFVDRRARADWDAYTPYEIRNLGAFVRLGWRERAGELLDFFLHDQRPAGWLQWAEVVDRRPRHPRFIGDMPHTWVGSDFIRAALDMLVYPREDEGVLVVGAGVQPAWLEGPGVEARGLRTPWGDLDLAFRRGEGEVTVTLGGSAAPPGGFRVRPPVPGPPVGASVNGEAAPAGADGEVTVRTLPATVVLRF